MHKKKIELLKIVRNGVKSQASVSKICKKGTICSFCFYAEA